MFLLSFFVIYYEQLSLLTFARSQLNVDLSTRAQSSSTYSSLYELAKYESFGFFDDIDNITWQRHKNRAQSEPIYNQPESPNARSGKMAWWLLANVDPMFTCPNLRRVGGHGDGPKWTCDPHRLAKQPDCLIYSVGSRGIYRFEDGIIAILQQQNSRIPAHDEWFPNCEIHVFDPDPQYAREDDAVKNNIHYHPWGLRTSVDATFHRGVFPEHFEFLSFQEIQKRLGHENRRIDILKIDCEGCEFTTYKDWLQSTVDIRQVLVETHRLPAVPSQFFDRFFDMGFVPFSKEANSHPNAMPSGEYFEWAWIRLHPDFLNRTSSLFNDGADDGLVDYKTFLRKLNHVIVPTS